MEGRIEYAFYPDRTEDRVNGVWPIWLENGHYLRVFGDDGRVLWEGFIELVPRGGLIFRERHDLPDPIWNDRKQRGVPYRRWIAWFWRRPPLRAELVLPSPSQT